jgi:acyl-CoA synthetase (AMP-forming)/AMP-acid ligase II
MISTAPALGLSLRGGRPDDVALVADGERIDYAELGERVRARRAELGDTRRLVMVAAGNALEPVVTYLAALEGGHPVLLVPGGDDEASTRHRAGLVERFDPDVIAAGRSDEWVLEERRRGTRHALHPDLAMLASTSGSTGSPKLVRLSAENLVSNADAIAEYLRLDTSDLAATTLPLQYCYGLSVLNSHLRAGAGVLLTDRSVTDEGFWNEASAHRVTSFAGVPYTFELLEANGFADRPLPHLRYVTQAGGRLAPDALRRLVALGERRDFEVFVMYGQTEATARMAYVPPDRIADAIGAIGFPIPGGRFRIDPAGPEDAEAGVGELVYSGPNVMMGYAQSPEELALGRTVTELRTGDLARLRADGLYEIVGRMSRFVKVFGLRLDLDRIEQLLADEGIEARAAAADERLLLFARSERTATRARRRAAELTGIPVHAVAAYAISEFPRTTNGKPDTAALLRHAHEQDEAATAGAGALGVDAPDSVRALFATLLGRPDATADDSFAGLGGDSLSYIEVGIRLEQLIGPLPRDWPALTARELAALARTPVGEPTGGDTDVGAPSPASGPPSGSVPPSPRRRPRWIRMETPVVLRTIAIFLVVATHADLISLKGGAHLLLAVAGYNLARFQLADVPGRSRASRLLSSAAQLAVPAVLWIGAVALVTGRYGPATVLLVNDLVPGGRWSEQWQYWFLEAMVWSLLALAALFALRAVDRLERRAPFAFALAVLAVAMSVRFALAGVDAQQVERYAAPIVVSFIALGWLVARARSVGRRVLVSVLAVVCTVGFFGEPAREAVVVAGVLALVWLPTLPLPRWSAPVVATVAGASMFVYLTHWQVYPPFEQSAPWLGTLLSFLVGVAVWRIHSRASAAVPATARRLGTSMRLLRAPVISRRSREDRPQAG